MKQIFIICLPLISFVLGCGKVPAGQGFPPRTATFCVECAALCRGKNTAIKKPPSALSKVNEVLEQQGRNAGLSYEAISVILEQLTVQTNYIPLRCDIVNINLVGGIWLTALDDMRESCYILGNVVNSLCKAPNRQNCDYVHPFTNIIPVPSQHLTISGNLTISNIIMAGWTTQMWQSVSNRVLRSLQTGRLGSNFATAVVTIP